MSTTADSTRRISRVWKGSSPGRWAAFHIGHSQPRGFRTYRRGRFLWQFHVTPLHLYRDKSSREFGVCFGKRTLFLMVHR